MTTRRTRFSASSRHQEYMLLDPDVHCIAEMVSEECKDSSLIESVDISTTLLTRIRQMLENGGTIVTDTAVMLEQINETYLHGTKATIKCFLENPEVVKLAERKMTSKAEVAVDTALSLNGPKLMVIGSAPAALARILKRRQNEPLTDVYIITAVNGFASVVSLKEKLRESHMTYGEIRGKSGGVTATAALVNSILRYIRISDK